MKITDLDKNHQSLKVHFPASGNVLSFKEFKDQLGYFQFFEIKEEPKIEDKIKPEIKPKIEKPDNDHYKNKDNKKYYYGHHETNTETNINKPNEVSDYFGINMPTEILKKEEYKKMKNYMIQ